MSSSGQYLISILHFRLVFRNLTFFVLDTDLNFNISKPLSKIYIANFSNALAIVERVAAPRDREKKWMNSIERWNWRAERGRRDRRTSAILPFIPAFSDVE